MRLEDGAAVLGEKKEGMQVKGKLITIIRGFLGGFTTGQAQFKTKAKKMK